MWLLAASIMLLPIAMVVLSLVLPYPAIRWTTLVVSTFLVVFDIAGLPYRSAFDNFLIAVSFVLTGFIVWQAWAWN